MKNLIKLLLLRLSEKAKKRKISPVGKDEKKVCGPLPATSLVRYLSLICTFILLYMHKYFSN